MGFGTILEIRDIQYFSDGRSVVDTIGARRFKVLERGSKDGYHTATVEYLHDVPPEGEELSRLQEQQDKIHDLAEVWFRSMTEDIRAGILSLDHQAQQQILSQTQLIRRLEAIGKILGYMK